VSLKGRCWFATMNPGDASGVHLHLEPETVFPEPEPEYRPEVRRGPHSDPPWTLEEFQEREYSERTMPLIAEAHRLEPLAPAAGEPAWRPPKRRRQRWDWRDKFR
jgi:hypothetical protein